MAAASVEPRLTPEEDFKARRLKAIRAKAVEIEKVVTFVPRNSPFLLSSNCFARSEAASISDTCCKPLTGAAADAGVCDVMGNNSLSFVQ